MYPEKFNLKAAESRQGLRGRRMTGFVTLISDILDRRGSFPFPPQVWDHFSCQFKCVRYRTTQRLDIHYRTSLLSGVFCANFFFFYLDKTPQTTSGQHIGAEQCVFLDKNMTLFIYFQLRALYKIACSFFLAIEFSLKTETENQKTDYWLLSKCFPFKRNNQ